MEREAALWPRGAKAAGAKPLAKRLDSLEGKVLGCWCKLSNHVMLMFSLSFLRKKNNES